MSDRYLVIGRYAPYTGSWRPIRRTVALGPFTSEDTASRRAYSLAERHGIETTVVALFGARRVEDFIEALTDDTDAVCSLCCGSGLAIDPAIPAPAQGPRPGSRDYEAVTAMAESRSAAERATGLAIQEKHAASTEEAGDG